MTLFGSIELSDDVVQRGGFGGHRQEFNARFEVRVVALHLAGAAHAEELDVRLTFNLYGQNSDVTSGQRLGRFEMAAGAADVTDTDLLTPYENGAAWCGLARYQCVFSAGAPLMAAISSSRREQSWPPTDTGVLDATFAR